MAQRRVFSTHDWTPVATYFPDPTDIFESWADTKTPGGMPRFDPLSGPFTPDERRTYCVGTTVVNTTRSTPHTFPGGWAVPAASFSGETAGTSSIPAFAALQPGDRRQVVILQCNRTDRGTDAAGNPDENGIVWQRFFYGLSGTVLDPDLTQPTNARAVSVWAGDSPETTRIAICGETWDQSLTLSQDPAGWTGNAPTGFIAVYDGDGELRWTYHFFVDSAQPQPIAVTDLAIHVDAEGQEVVTYCGVTKTGNPGPGTWMSPVGAFPSPGAGLSAGDEPLLPGQWDGFVGRIVYTAPNVSVPPTTAVAQRIFHAFVGGPEQDGLFGLAEVTPTRFVVVGSTQQEQAGTPAFPAHFLGNPILTVPHRVGAALVFDVDATGAWFLETGIGLGSESGAVATIARDVAVGFDVALDYGGGSFETRPAVYVVGSTTDDEFKSISNTLGAQPFLVAPGSTSGGTFGGDADGFVAVLHDRSSELLPYTFTYWGGEGDDGLTGVNCWNEFSEHIAVTGFTPGSPVDMDIGVTTYLLDNAFGQGVPSSSSATASNSGRLRRMRDTTVGGSRDDRPAMMAPFNATDEASGTPGEGAFRTFELDQPAAGGGVSVANDGRVTAVGRTNQLGTTYPVDGLQARSQNLGCDAVRTDLDMLPRSTTLGTPIEGVGRTDGTGWQGPGIAPNFPIPGASGGTTPTCGLSRFGWRVTDTAAPPVSRMLIDYEGAPPMAGVDDACIVVSRPATAFGSIAVGVLWFGFPQATGPAVVDGVEFWSDPASWTLFFDLWPGSRAYRLPLTPFPTVTGSITVSAQLQCLLDPTPGAGSLGWTPVTHGAGCASEFVASPALWFSF